MIIPKLPVRESAADHEDEDVHGDEVDEEDVSAPRGDHVEVGHGAEGCPVDVPGLDTLDPEVVGEQHAEDGDALIVVAARHGAGDVSGDDGDHSGRRESGPDTVQLRREEVRHDGGQRGEEGGEEHANLPDINTDVDAVEKVVDDAGGDHETGVDGSSNDTTQRIPGTIIKPVVEIVETILRQIFGCAIVEVWIKLMNNRFKPVGKK